MKNVKWSAVFGRYVQLLVKVSLLVGCGTWLGNPPDKEGDGPKKNQLESEAVTLIFTALEERTFDVTDRNGNVIAQVTLQENRHVLKDVYLYADTKPSEPAFQGPYVLDLLTGEVTPKPQSKDLQVGVYKTASITGHVLQAGEIPGLEEDDPLIGKTSIIRGQLKIGSLQQPFEFAFDWNDELVVNDSGKDGGPSEVVAGLSNELVIAIDYSKWFQVDSLTDLADGKKMGRHLVNSLKNNTSFRIERAE